MPDDLGALPLEEGNVSRCGCEDGEQAILRGGDGEVVDLVRGKGRGEVGERVERSVGIAVDGDKTGGASQLSAKLRS